MMLVNGREGLSVPVADRGFQYGDGCFTTLEVRDGAPLFLARHQARLSRDCARLQIPYDCADQVVSEARSLAEAGRDGVLKIIVTRGAGGRGYRCPDVPQASRILGFYPRPVYPSEWAASGVVVRVCRMRLGNNPALAGIKHMNRLEQVLARSEWSDAEIAEGLLLDAQGWVTEGVMSNVFMVRDGRLETPRLNRCGVAGVMRELVAELAGRMGIAVREGRCRLSRLREADEVFVTNSLIGIWPVRRPGRQGVAGGFADPPLGRGGGAG
ncbi:aminodeoxychorismate lyase [Methylogaea oryzae]|uniref:aminodeoxychorismate lyase n=1 Tax=Methylogaea oryzae TaxID=1295382 RepID=UPI000B12E8C3|nr:aminodeoxychorismate lyase [Methylogaea oryzae]